MRGSDTDVVVVGAGVMGLATARALAQTGRDVVVLEQFEIGHERGSSHGASRIVRLSYPEERWVRLAQESFPLWRELEAESGQELLELYGTVDLGDWEPNRDALAACGVESEVLDAAEVARRFPIRIEGSHALYQRDGGIIHADAALDALTGSAVAAGVQVRERHRAAAIEEDSDGVTVDGIRAQAVVVTAGAWAPKLVELEARTTSETVAYFDYSEEPLPSVLDTTTGERPGYALTAPGGMLKAGLHQSGRAIDPDEPTGPDEELAARAAAWVERRFPAAGGAVRLETCLYTIRANDEFLLERRGRVVVGSACSGHGFKFAPAIGTRLAALVSEAPAAKRPL